MAYKYDDFITAASSAGMLDRFTETDMETAKKSPEYGLSLLNIMRDGDNASTAEQKLLATEAANQLRKSFSTAGTGAGVQSSYTDRIKELENSVADYSPFAYEGETAYQKALAAVQNPEKFDYDPSEDKTFSSYKKVYNREGERAAANALAQASAASGGRASSYAQTAAQQAANYYAGQLADMTLSLEQNAYQRYLNDQQAKMDQLSVLQAERDESQQQWQSGYDLLLSKLNALRTQEETEYQRKLDEFNRALQQYQLLGYATPEIAQILGLDLINNPYLSGGSAGAGTNGAAAGTVENTLLEANSPAAQITQTAKQSAAEAVKNAVAQAVPVVDPQTGLPADVTPDQALDALTQQAAAAAAAPQRPAANPKPAVETEETRKIKKLQSALGVAQTGNYDRDTAAAAMQRGYTTMDSAYQALVGGTSLTTTKQAEIADYVKGLLDSGTSAAWRTKNIINNSSRFSDTEKKYALEVLNEYQRLGYMLR